MRFGMYQGRALLPGVRSLYGAAVRRLVTFGRLNLLDQALIDERGEAMDPDKARPLVATIQVFVVARLRLGSDQPSTPWGGRAGAASRDGAW